MKLWSVKLLVLAAATWAAASGHLKIGFYDMTCPMAEKVVRKIVSDAFNADADVLPGLIRLQFHDCFVEGCDASCTLKSTPGNKAEMDADINFSLEGFDEIEAAKTAVEAACPGVVSCADIIAFAARDSVKLGGGVHYDVPAGRLDGRVSLASAAEESLPSPLFNASRLIDLFASNGLNEADLATLSGAHTIGEAHCRSIANRLYNFSSSADGVDPTLSPSYASLLQQRCPFGSAPDNNTTVDLDIITPDTVDNRYYVELENNLALFSSDVALLTRKKLRDQVRENARNGNLWAAKFAKAMVKMSQIGVKTGNQGEIRKTCGAVNSPPPPPHSSEWAAAI